ncbi:MFS transporter [Amycolatopsis thermalba]|uniref:MFS transporter n=1 Tax=Amycolatopsis thermalba TaxID=944492 RepID=A0ABY4NV87_9PSEU|nr:MULTISPECIES: MFS transporter [Amycolatopsis]UQS23994.1 MFS transporter [Amycolatopsis thermalba]
MSEPAERERLRYAWRALSVVSMASIVTALGSSSLNVALPEVVRHFHAGAAAASWMLLSFMLANTVLMVVFGRLADLFGRRTLYLCGLATYTGASLLLGFSPGAWWLVGLRVVQAAGGAMLLTNSAAILTDAFPRRHLGRGMGVYIASFSVAQLIGPTLGGFLTHRFGWQWVFWFNVPLGVACLAWGAVTLRRTGGAGQDRGLDVPGNLLVLVSLGGLLFGLSQAGERGWADPVVLAGVVLFAVLLPVFAVVERRSPHPVVDVRLFADRVFALGLLASFLNTVARMAVVLLVALFYQAVHGEDPVSAGLRVLPLPVAAMIASACAGPLHARMSARAAAALGTVTGTAGLAVLLAVVSADGSYAPVCVALVLIGAGSGMFMPANTTALLDELPPHRVGIVNAMRLMVQNTGVVMSTALALSLVTSPLPAALRPSVFAGTLSRLHPAEVGLLVTGYRLALGVMTAISVVAVLTSAGGRRAEPAGRDLARPAGLG